MKSFRQILDKAQNTEPLILAVAEAADDVVLQSVKMAQERGIVKPVLIGDQENIKEICKELDFEPDGEIINTKSREESAHRVMELVASKEADLPMKGDLDTRIILRALLDKKYNLRSDRLLSLITMINLQKENRIVLMTDAGMNIKPGLEEKIQIINNAVKIALAIGMNKPAVAALAAVEKVNPAMPATVEAATLAKMSDRGQISDAVVDGPFAFDNAISPEAAKHKGIESPVAGKADILLLDDIESGNILYKALVVYSALESASVVYGAKIPLIVTSRSDSVKTKFNSIALGKLVILGLRNKFNI